MPRMQITCYGYNAKVKRFYAIPERHNLDHNCMHDEVENLVCIDCGRAFENLGDWRDAQAEARQS